MKITGIIAEYNPFHNGHLYHLAKARELSQADGVICIMSGNFMQRGEPALADKWARAEMAVSCGSDVVLELPALYATKSAYWFARGGLETLMNCGVVTHLAFGAESADSDALNRVSTYLTHETQDYQKSLRKALKTGVSFPKARALALEEQLEENSQLWSKPNNILALTYLQVIHELKLPLTPVAVARLGAGFHDASLEKESLPSATAIRNTLAQYVDNPGKALNNLTAYLPEATILILRRQFASGLAPVFFAQLEPALMTLLRRKDPKSIEAITEVGEGLQNRICKIAREATNISDFLEKMKTKRYPYTRLQRLLTHLLLDYTKEKEKLLPGGPPYLRVLGFNSRGRKILQEIKKSASCPLIVKGAGAKTSAQSDHRYSVFWETDCLATDLYSLLYPDPAKRRGGLDYLRGPVRPL